VSGVIGRPTRLTPDRQARIVQAVRGGCTYEAAARLAGVHRDSVHHWLKRGAQEETGRYKEFSDAFACARAEAEVLLVGAWLRIGMGTETNPGDPVALAEFVARRFPQRWGRPRKGRTDVGQVGTVREDLLARLDRMAERFNEPIVIRTR
jgi:hypothetical protein